MSVFEALSLILAFLAFAISCFSLYRSMSGFRGELFARSRVILTKFDNLPTIIIGCDAYNRGATSGAITDVLLLVNYKSGSAMDERGNRRQISEFYTFYPYIMKDDYKIMATSQTEQFEKFQTILVPPRLRFTKHIAFDAGSQASFTPRPGTYELKLSWKDHRGKKYNAATNKRLTLSIDEQLSDAWSKGEDLITVESQESIAARSKYIGSSSSGRPA
ncbi:hypothetical protein U2F10_21760 [Leptothoe sp. EHU-05/26/07-4]